MQKLRRVFAGASALAILPSGAFSCAHDEPGLRHFGAGPSRCFVAPARSPAVSGWRTEVHPEPQDDLARVRAALGVTIVGDATALRWGGNTLWLKMPGVVQVRLGAVAGPHLQLVAGVTRASGQHRVCTVYRLPQGSVWYRCTPWYGVK